MSIALLGEICRTTSGGTPSRKRPDFFNGSIPWVKSGELTDGLVSEVEEFVTEEAIASSSAKVFPAGTLLIALYGATVGKLGILSRTAATNQAVCAVFPSSNLDTKFLFWNLRHRRADLIAQAVGGAQPNISQTILRNLEIQVPTLDTQREVVAEIEKQFSRLDEAVAGLKRVKANLKRYKAVILKAAVEGRLVPTEADLARREGRNYETGAQLLQRILDTRRSQWQAKGRYKEPAVPNTTTLPELPDGWTWSSLDSLSWDSGYGTSEKCSYENDGPAVLRIPNVQDGTLDLKDMKFAPSTFAMSAREAVAAGDMLVIRTNGSKSLIGKAALVVATPSQALGYASYLIRFRLMNLGPLAHWISVVWQTPQIRSWIEAHAATSAGQHNISMTTLATAAVPLPPTAEQHRIVAEVDRLHSIAREAEVEVESNLKRAEVLRRTVLNRMFSDSSAFEQREVPEPLMKDEV